MTGHRPFSEITRKMSDKRFYDLWQEAYLAYLKIRQQHNMPLSEDQISRLKATQNGNGGNGKKT